MRWWEGRQGTNRMIIAAFGGLALLAMLVTGYFTYLAPGDSRQVLINVNQGLTDADRTTLKEACGHLPGISVIADKGNPARQFAFPVRFRLTGSTPQQESALYACVNRYPRIVKGIDPVTREGE